jgi:hypothetical protein
MGDRRTDLMIRHSKINNAFFGEGTIMEPYEVESKINGLRNWKINFGEYSVALGRYDRTPERWAWSLWRNNDSDLIEADAITFDGLKITAEQVARVIMLLCVDYADAKPYACPHGCGYEASDESKINFHLFANHSEPTETTF